MCFEHKLILQTPEEVHTFTTSCAERLPLLHLILRDSSEKPIQKVLQFLNNIPDLFKMSSNVSADGRKAGQYYHKQAQTLLCEAAKNDDNLAIVLALINADTLVDDLESISSPLICAAEYGSTEVIKALIDSKVSVDRCNAKRETSLFKACEHVQWDAAKLLYDSGADPLITNEDGNSAFTVAKEKHGTALLQYMAESNDIIRKMLLDCISLPDACRYGYDLVARNYDRDTLSAEKIKDAVTQSCLSRSTAILEYFATRLDDHSLSRQITQAYEADHCDCVNVLIKVCAERQDLPCPEISLANTCKTVAFTNLTYFLIEKDQDVNNNNGEPLRSAAKHGNINAVKHLINFGANVNMKSTTGETPLLLACEGNHLDIVDVLLNCTANVNVETDEKETPLTASCTNGNLQIVNSLLSSSKVPDLKHQNRYGKAPLEITTDNYHFEIAMALVNKGAHLPTEWGSSSNEQFLQKLCHVGNTDLVKNYLRMREGTVAVSGHTLGNVIRADNVELLKLLLASDKMHVDKKDLLSALKCACMTGSVSIVKLIIEYDNGKFWQSVEKDNKSHLYVAVRHEHAPLVAFLIDSGCIPHEACPLSAAFRSKDILSCLLQYDIPTDSLNTALMAVCKAGHRTAEFCARKLLDKSAEVNYEDWRDPQRLTVLMAATLKSSVSLVTLLLERGANPNITDNTGRSPLFVACDLGNHEIVSLLLYNKFEGGSANPDLPGTPSEKCPLWTACVHDHLDLVDLLMKNKANPNVKEHNGCYLVQKAHMTGHYEVVRLLLESGADPLGLVDVSLLESCHHGYSEYVQSICQGARFEELKMFIREASQNGYPETAMGIIINMTDKNNQKECYDVWKQIWQRVLPTVSAHDVVPRSRDNNPLWQCFHCNDHQEMARLIIDGEDPNITNRRGTPLLHACLKNKMHKAVFALCNSPKLDINQKDELGRTVLFYTLDWFLVMHDGKKCCMFDYLLKRGADVLPDDFGRTLLHAWQTVPPCCIQSLTLEELTKHVAIDQADYKGQTALHIAVLENNPDKVRELLNAGSNPQVLDVNKISPLSLAKQHQKSTIFKMLSKRCLVEENWPGVVHNVSEPENVHFSNEYKTEHRVTGALNKLFRQSNQTTSSNQFMEKYKIPVQISEKAAFLSEFNLFRSTVLSFMKDIGSAVSKEDPLFGFEPVLSGSCSEGTKVSEMSEADVLCWFQHPDWEHISLATHERNNYAYMKVESRKLAAKHPALFRTNHLSVHGVFERLYALVRKNIAQVLRHYGSLYLLDGSRILHSDRAICPLQLVWSGKLFKWQPFSLDVVPAIPVSVEKLPGKLNHHILIHDLYIVPKWTAALSETEYSDLAFQLGFSYTEKDFFYAMPDHLRQGYKLAKVVLHDCMIIDDVPPDVFLSSYMLKCETFECFTEMSDFSDKMKGCTARNLFDAALCSPKQVIEWADKILVKLEHYIAKQHLESFFLPGSDLLGHSQYKIDQRPLLYTRLCRAMLHSPSENIAVWAQLAQSVADQLCRPENLLREAFVAEIQMLREMGLDRNYRWENGCNLFFFMIKYDLEIGVQNLLEWGTSVKNVDGRGTSALDLAAVMDLKAIEELLVEICGKHNERCQE